ncbi:bifunctional enzyme IspD/IspF-like [Penaeus chinensis]|uniref:bifunctional enzyme IspD/IspF-like n=1 Tax=Penaeus chinensis TaxID=139456 RepID=UPI001FB7F917|nr:bifunctional enzyme IspD/IspF-like [Penaeus chinensis]
MDPQAEPRWRVAAVVPAAGCGERMALETPKQYLEVCGRPLIAYCLASFEEVPWLTKVVVVADDVRRMTQVLADAGLSKAEVVQGCRTRHRSIRVGLTALAEDPPEVVVVHDGVRPLVPLATLRQVVAAAAERGAAGAVRPLVSTVLRPAQLQEHGAAELEVLQESLVRSDFRNSEMPQAFRFAVITQAYGSCSDEELDHGTECLALALKHTGVRAALVPGTPDLWKVTEARDLVVARAVLPRHTRHIAVLCGAPPPVDSLGTTPAGIGREELATQNPGRSTRAAVPFLTSLASDSNSDGGTDDGWRLECGAECTRVIGLLGPRLRSHSSSHGCYHSLQDLQRLSSDARGRTSVAVVAVTSLRGRPRSLRPYLEELKQGLGVGTSCLILILSLDENKAKTEEESGSFHRSLDIPALQEDVRQTFQGHGASVTILLRNPTGRRIPPIDQKEMDEVGQKEKESQFLDLMEAVLQQHSRAFHGQVLVA